MGWGYARARTTLTSSSMQGSNGIGYALLNTALTRFRTLGTPQHQTRMKQTRFEPSRAKGLG